MPDEILDPSEPLDYRYGGETWDTFSLKYLQTIPYIFRVLNALNGTDDTGVVLPTPSGAGAIVRKNADGTVTINVMGNASTSDKLKTARNITLTGKAQGSASFDGSSDVTINVSNVSGNAEAIATKTVDTTNIADGTIPVYRSASNKFEMESKGTVGAGQTLTIKFGNTVLGTFSGDVACEVDIAPSVEQASSSGNSATATKLQTPRSINGTAFDGSTNVTTATWGTARDISIQDATGTNTGTAVSVNGGATVTLKLPATIKANLTGNSATATKLQTPRAINGTNFDGSAAITTSKWGTARNISVQDATGTNTGAAVSVDGSGNATLKLPATIKGNVTGNCSGSSGSCTGNSATSTKVNGKTVAVVSSFSNGTLALTGLS